MTKVQCAVFAAIAAAISAVSPVQAQENWPTRSIRLVVPYAPSGATDIAARVIADTVSSEIGQPIVVDNRGGAGGNTGVAIAADAPADGYTMLMATQTLLTQNPYLYPDLSKNAQKDMVPVGGAFSTDMIMVASPKLGVKTIDDVIKLAKSKPGALNFGSAGNGSFAHVLMELFMIRTGTSMKHIAYRGTGPAMTDLVAGTIDLMIDSMPSAIGQIKGGAVIPIAVCGPKRNPRLRDVPTFTEAGVKEFSTTAWLSVMAPKGTPRHVIDKMNAAMKKTLAKPVVIERADRAGMDPDFLTPKEQTERIKKESAIWEEVIKKTGIKGS